MEENGNAPVVYGPVGIKGWLLFFCLSLTVFTPVFFYISTMSDYEQISSAFSRYPGLRTITILNIVIGIGISIFGIYAGISLWKKKQGAVSLAKLFLKTSLSFTMLSLFLPQFAGLPSEAKSAMLSEALKLMIRPIIYFSIWYAYLDKSIRVLNTYHNP